jgi:restriction endonuclease SmaI-like protein
MPRRDKPLFTEQFKERLRHWVGTHHTIYPRLPPQGIYFESLVERTFLHSGWPRDQVVLEHPNSPKADIRIGDTRLSLKTETGRGTRRDRISITKLCTTETGDWVSNALIEHAVSHLSRYEGILMLRAIWSETKFDYQLIDVPISLLEKMRQCEALPVGKRMGRRSLGFDVSEDDEILFHVHFDGADGKCQVRNLRVDRCITIMEWQQEIRD